MTGPLGWPLARSLLRSCRFFACSAHSAACSAQRALLPRSTVLVCSRIMVIFDVSASGYLVTLLHRQPWSPSAFDKNSPKMMAILHCSAGGVRLLLLALIKSCFEFGIMVSIFLLIRRGDIGSSKKRCPTKEKKKCKKEKRRWSYREMKTCIGRLLKRFSINVKKKWKKKWRWPTRKIKIWYKHKNIVVFILAWKWFSNRDYFGWYSLFNV